MKVSRTIRTIAAAATLAAATFTMTAPAEAYVTIEGLKAHIIKTHAGGVCGKGFGILCRVESIRSAPSPCWPNYWGGVNRRFRVKFTEFLSWGRTGRNYYRTVDQTWNNWTLTSGVSKTYLAC